MDIFISSLQQMVVVARSSFFSEMMEEVLCVTQAAVSNRTAGIDVNWIHDKVNCSDHK